MTNYQQNRLNVINGILKQIEKDKVFFKKYFLHITAFGLFFSFIAPFYGRGKNSILSLLNSDYELAFFTVLGTYTFLCLLAHFVFGIQYRLRTKKLLRIKKSIEEDIANKISNRKYNIW